jgi:hypothetical protein
MTRENAAAKGARYLLEARLIVEQVDGDLVRASCRGSGAIYELGYTPDRGWWCDCPAVGLCSHLSGLMLVTVRRRPA